MRRIFIGLGLVAILLGLASRLRPLVVPPRAGRDAITTSPVAAPHVSHSVPLLSPTSPSAESAASFSFSDVKLEHGLPSEARARDYLALAARRVEGRGPLVLLGLREVPRPEQRAAWSAHGLRLLGYVPDRGWMARLEGDAIAVPAATLAWAAREVTCLVPLAAESRLDSRLREGAGDEVPVYVHPAPDADLKRLQSDLARQGLALGPSGSYLAGRLSRIGLETALAVLGRHPDVQYVERGSGARLLNTTSAKILQSGSYLGPLPIYAQGLYGSNQVIAVLDTGIDFDSCYFRDPSGNRPPTNFSTGTTVDLTQRKIIACDFWAPGDNPGGVTNWDSLFHGTRVAGHAAGSDLTFPVGTNQNNGMAPGARLVVQDAGYTGPFGDACGDIPGMGCPVTNFLRALKQAYAQGARIHNNSWGDNENAAAGIQNLYSAVSAELDAMTWSNRDLLIVCAAGNSGADDIVGSPSTAKNGLSVAAGGAGASQDAIASFSSRGWTKDGRIKPDLTAPGQSVTSANNDGNITTFNCTISTGDGTSYASPMICGLAALVRDYFAQGYYPSRQPTPADTRTNISAALVKAMLINSCVDMPGAGARPPARDQGWGRPNLSRALIFTNASASLFVDDHGPVFVAAPELPVVQGFEVTGTSQPFKVTLVWTDPPGTPGAGKQLVNDLDVVVRTKEGVYHGNALSNGVSYAGVASDRSNNVEQVILPAAYTGLVEVSVWASVIPQATQDFALVATGVFSNETADADGDGMPEYWEKWHFRGLGPADAHSDHDGDGVADAAEYAAGTDPTNAWSLLRLSGISGNGSGLQFSADLPPGRRFDLFFSDGPDVAVGAPFFASEEGGGLHVTGLPETNQAHVFTDSLSLTNGSGPASAGPRLYHLRASAR